MELTIHPLDDGTIEIKSIQNRTALYFGANSYDTSKPTADRQAVVPHVRAQTATKILDLTVAVPN
jgi:hypothetical protein